MSEITTVKTSVSIQKNLWQLLASAKNKSRLINEALELYFDHKSHQEVADKAYWDMIETNLAHGLGDYVSVNQSAKSTTEAELEATLWN